MKWYNEVYEAWQSGMNMLCSYEHIIHFVGMQITKSGRYSHNKMRKLYDITRLIQRKKIFFTNLTRVLHVIQTQSVSV